MLQQPATMSNGPRSVRYHVLRRAALLMTLLLWWPAASQSQAILANEVTNPRSFGYVVGDKIRREVHLNLRSGYRLDEASLPKPGRLDRWLEVAAPEVGVEPISNGQRYRLVLTYQLFNAPQALETVTVPQQNLRIVGASQALTTLIPALRVTIAPLTSAIPLDRLTDASLQDDRSARHRCRSRRGRRALHGRSQRCSCCRCTWPRDAACWRSSNARTCRFRGRFAS